MASSKRTGIAGWELAGEPKLTLARLLTSTVLAAVCAALPYPLFYILVNAFTCSSFRELHNVVDLAAWIFSIAVIVSFAHVVLLGVPIVLALARFRALRFRNVSVAGAVAGVVPVSLLGVSRGVLWCAFFGLIGASAFWLGLTVRRRGA